MNLKNFKNIEPPNFYKQINLIGIFFTLFLFISGGGKFNAQTNDQAAIFRNNAAHTGVYDTKPVKNFGGLQWRFQTGGTVNSSPVIFKNVLYIGSSDGFLYALDAVSGAEKWRFNVNSPVNSAPAVLKDAVFVTARDGRLLAIDALSQKLRWEFKTGTNAPLAWGYESGDYFVGSPIVYENKIIFGSGDGFLYAVEATTGKTVWKFKTDGRVRSTPAVSQNTIYFGSFDGSFYAVNLADGKLKWRFETEGSKLNSGDFGFDRRSIQSSAAVADGKVFFGSRDGFTYALDAASGKQIWRVDHDASWINSSPAVSDGRVYAGTSDGKFFEALDANTGEVVWRLNADGVVWSSPAIAGNYIYFADSAGNVFAADRQSGKELWRYRAQKRIFSSPLVDDGRLYFGCDDGGIYAVNSTQGGSLKRAVFWDENYVKGAIVRSHEAVRDFLKNSDYEILDEQKNAEFMNERIKDRSPSVVVFAIDHLPKSLNDAKAEKPLLRQYLEAGGKVVWIGTPPLIWEKNLQTGERAYNTINREAAGKLLGIDYKISNFDPFYCRATDDGKKWGIGGWWTCNWSIDPKAAATVLMSNELGLASAWIKNYGGAGGTGFIRFPVNEDGSGKPLNLIEIKTVAEYLPK
jgi:outer membrane protein assembly factor BamB